VLCVLCDDCTDVAYFWNYLRLILIIVFLDPSAAACIFVFDGVVVMFIYFLYKTNK
jgi:hypothetical protein